MAQVVRMYIYPEAQAAEIILSVCKLGTYLTAGSTSRIVLSIVDCENIRGLRAALATYKLNEPTACLSLWLDGKKYKFDMSLWPEILECLNDFFALVDGEIDPLFNRDITVDDGEQQDL